MFGLKSSILLGGALAVAASGIGGFFVGKDYGRDSVMSEWRKEKIETQKRELEYIVTLNNTLTDLRNTNQELARKVDIQYVDRVRTITETKYQNRDVIREVFKDSPFLTKGWVYTHNQLVDGTPIDPALASDQTVSAFTEKDSLEVIGNNYATARQTKAQNEGIKEFYEGVLTNYSAASDSVRKDNPAPGN